MSPNHALLVASSAGVVGRLGVVVLFATHVSLRRCDNVAIVTVKWGVNGHGCGHNGRKAANCSKSVGVRSNKNAAVRCNRRLVCAVRKNAESGG